MPYLQCIYQVMYWLSSHINSHMAIWPYGNEVYIKLLDLCQKTQSFSKIRVCQFLNWYILVQYLAK
jgi:hypothetical protein